MKGAENKMLAKKRLITVGCTAAVAIAALAAVMVFGGKEKTPDYTSSVADVLEPVTEPPTQPVTDPVTADDFDYPNQLTGHAKYLLSQNDDTVGYVRISNTNIDYPVVQCKEDNEYYLHKGFNKEYNFAGVIYMDYRNNFGIDESLQSDNIVLYGHNMLNGTMFADLHKYRKDSTFIEDNCIVEFSSNYVDYQYVVVGYLLTDGGYGDTYYGEEEFPYWDLHNFSNESEFNSYMDNVRERAEKHCNFVSDVDVKYGDKLLTLQTCHLDADNSRMLVVARRLRDHETADNIDRNPVQATDATDATEVTEGSDEE